MDRESGGLVNSWKVNKTQRGGAQIWRKQILHLQVELGTKIWDVISAHDRRITHKTSLIKGVAVQFSLVWYLMDGVCHKSDW